MITCPIFAPFYTLLNLTIFKSVPKIIETIEIVFICKFIKIQT